MSIGLQKANFFKRISAWLFDIVMCVVLATGCMALMAELINYDFQYTKLTELETKYSELQQPYLDAYEAEHGVNFDITQEAFEKLSEEERAALQAHLNAFNEELSKKEDIQKQYALIEAQSSVVTTYTFLMISISLLIVFIAWYFIVPYILRDGRTFGKKIFGLAVMRTNSVRVSNPVLFIRSILGMYTMETMAPIFFLLMTYFGMGPVGFIAAVLVAVLDIAVMICTPTRSSIHDLLADTVVVDFSSQRIFESQEALNEYLASQSQTSDFNQTPKANID
ncbi:MAG: hypothetical protein E7371_02805 [Clostridiales bacterium]|nr:hypothetical protein [Clostridiales bacterium]